MQIVKKIFKALLSTINLRYASVLYHLEQSSLLSEYVMIILYRNFSVFYGQNRDRMAVASM